MISTTHGTTHGTNHGTNTYIWKPVNSWSWARFSNNLLFGVLSSDRGPSWVVPTVVSPTAWLIVVCLKHCVARTRYIFPPTLFMSLHVHHQNQMRVNQRLTLLPQPQQNSVSWQQKTPGAIKLLGTATIKFVPLLAPDLVLSNQDWPRLRPAPSSTLHRSPRSAGACRKPEPESNWRYFLTQRPRRGCLTVNCRLFFLMFAQTPGHNCAFVWICRINWRKHAHAGITAGGLKPWRIWE